MIEFTMYNLQFTMYKGLYEFGTRFEDPYGLFSLYKTY